MTGSLVTAHTASWVKGRRAGKRERLTVAQEEGCRERACEDSREAEDAKNVFCKMVGRF